MKAATNMKIQTLYLLMLVTALETHTLVHANCDIFTVTLENINSAEQEDYKKARKEYINASCGHESQSWIGGAAGRRRFEYIRCKLRSQNSKQFQNEWSNRADLWEAKREELETQRLSSDCAE